MCVYTGWGPASPLRVAWTERVGAPVVQPPLPVGSDFVVALDSALIRVSAHGDPMWRIDREGAGAAALVGDTLWVPFEQTVVRIDATSGRVVGQDSPRDAAVMGPAVGLGTGGAYLLRTGEAVSSQGSGREALSAAAAPVSMGDTLFFVTEEGEVVAWSPSGLRWVSLLDGPGRGRPALDETRVFATTAVFDGQPGSISALSQADGALLWRQRVDYQTLGGLGLYGDALLISEAGGRIRALSRETGDELWSVELNAGLTSGLAVAGSRAYVGTAAGELVAIDLDDGVVWTRLELGASPIGAPAISGRTLVVGLSDGRLVGIQGGS